MSQNPFETLASPQRINEIVENVLLITLNPENPKNLYLMNNDGANQFWTMETIGANLFERLMALAFESASDNNVIPYLYSSHLRLHNENRTRGKTEVSDVLYSLIFRNLSTILKEPELFPEQNISSQFLDIFKDNELEDTALRDEFLSCAIKQAMDDSDNDMKRNIREIFFKCFDECLKGVKQASMISLEKWILSFLMAFSSDKTNPEMANLFLDYIALPPDCDGIKYANGLLGEVNQKKIGAVLQQFFIFRSIIQPVNHSEKQPRTLRVLRQLAKHKSNCSEQLIVVAVDLSEDASRLATRFYQRLSRYWRRDARKDP